MPFQAQLGALPMILEDRRFLPGAAHAKQSLAKTIESLGAVM
jgi:hypothetical protein